MRAFRTGKVDVLVATDVAARGLDVDDVTHVVNYECPEDDKAYLHRTGRTGRAGRTGVAVTFVDWADMQRWKLINEALGLGLPEPAGDILDLRAPVQRAEYPAGTRRAPCPRPSAGRPGPGGRGPRGHRRDRPEPVPHQSRSRRTERPGGTGRAAATLPGAARTVSASSGFAAGRGRG